MKLSVFQQSRTILASLITAGTMAATSGSLFAGPADDKLAKSVIEPEPESRIHALLQVEVGDHYITPRGLNVVDQGINIQPLLIVFFTLYSNPDGFLNDITLAPGVWNDWGTHQTGANPGQWNEIDPFVGLTFKFAKAFQFDANYTAFRSMTDSYPTSTNLDLKLTYHDSFMGQFSVNPYVEFFDELSNKATVTFDTRTSRESYYFSLGLDPTYKFKSIPLTVEIPSYVNIVGKDFYQRFDGSPGGSGAAIISTGIKLSTPLSFIPKSYGSWTAYAGFQYYHINNEGALDGNVATTKPERDRNLERFYGGISVFF